MGHMSPQRLPAVDAPDLAGQKSFMSLARKRMTRDLLDAAEAAGGVASAWRRASRRRTARCRRTDVVARRDRVDSQVVLRPLDRRLLVRFSTPARGAVWLMPEEAARDHRRHHDDAPAPLRIMARFATSRV
jgi:hypothetical protein